MRVFGIGLANVDLLSYVSDAFLNEHKVPKGLATKFDDLPFGRLRGALKKIDVIPGGCVANTLCGLAAAGIPAQFAGKIGEDSFESAYRSGFSDYGVTYEIEPSSQESSQCAVLVTPDGERSFAYTHGASWDLAPEDLDEQAMADSGLIYTEVYIFEFGQNNNTARAAFETASKHSVPLAMKVMDRDFGQRYAQKIKALADNGTLNLLIGNHENMPGVTGTDTLEDTIQAFKSWNGTVLLTANKGGCYVIRNGESTHYPTRVVENPKNTTGAGDQFVAGFLGGWLERQDIAECVKRGQDASRLILGHDAARPPLVFNAAIPL